MGLLGIDLGTSSVKVMVLDSGGNVLASSKADYVVMTPKYGWVESDPRQWWAMTVEAVQAALSQVPSESIHAIGLSGQMHGIVLLDASGIPLRPAILWADARAETELALFRLLPSDLLESLANPLVPGMAGPQLCWVAHHEPDIYQQTRWMLQPKDWIRYCLTQTIATDPSDASATLLYNIPTDSWYEQLVDLLGLRRDLLPPILPSSALAGKVTEEAAHILLVPPGTPVATGAADTAAALLGTGLLIPGQSQLTVGTGAQIVRLQATPEFDPARRIDLYRAADGINWYAMAAVQNAGLSLDWVCRMVGATWDELFASATSTSPGADGLVFLPFLTRERLQPFDIGGFYGLRIDHRRETILQAALEGVACNIRTAWEYLPDHSTESMRLAGGGSLHPQWRQLLADMLGRDLLLVDVPNASARGAALLGGIAVGMWNTASDVPASPTSLGTVIFHDPQQHARYDAVYQRYLHIAESMATH
jgi:xylulokinase